LKHVKQTNVKSAYSGVRVVVLLNLLTRIDVHTTINVIPGFNRSIKLETEISAINAKEYPDIAKVVVKIVDAILNIYITIAQHIIKFQIIK
tara:strand:- start:119 stop:391 length:273 start_codon:yes stop_codon:yes gene_type:complete